MANGGGISWTNHVLSDLDGVAALTATSFTSASIDSAYPAANCLDPDPSLVTQVDYVNSSGSTRTLTLTSTFSSSNDKTTRLMAALNVRLEIADITGSITLLALNSSGSTLGTVSFSAAALDPIPGTTDRFNLFGLLSADVSAAAMSLNVPIATGNSGYIEVGYLWAGPAIVWDKGAGIDWTMGFADSSPVATSRAGGFASLNYAKRRTLSISRPGITYEEALGTYLSTTALSLRKLAQEVGLSERVVAISSYNRDAHAAQVMSVYGRLTSLPEINHLGKWRFNSRLAIEEIR